VINFQLFDTISGEKGGHYQMSHVSL